MGIGTEEAQVLLQMYMQACKLHLKTELEVTQTALKIILLLPDSIAYHTKMLHSQLQHQEITHGSYAWAVTQAPRPQISNKLPPAFAGS